MIISENDQIKHAQQQKMGDNLPWHDMKNTLVKVSGLWSECHILKTLINWKNYSSLFYKWRCWCVCGLMVSVWPEERSSISSYISDSSERWEIDCFTGLVFHSWLQSFCSNIQPRAILALPSVSNVWVVLYNWNSTITDFYTWRARSHKQKCFLLTRV